MPEGLASVLMRFQRARLNGRNEDLHDGYDVRLHGLAFRQSPIVGNSYSRRS